MQEEGVVRRTATFARAARCYWLEIFPLTRRELSYWRRRAAAIPDPALRRDALFTLRTKWGHSEGAAAFAVLVPRPHRKDFVRMAIAYELMVDYLDTTSERTADDPFGNTLRLHLALPAALALEAPRDDYYSSHPHCDDGGYLSAHIAACREIVVSLPSLPMVWEEVRRLPGLYAEAQGFTHAAALGLDESSRAKLTLAEAFRHRELRWGEIVAAGGSTMTVFALLAAATTPAITEHDAQLIGSAYYPWPSALHILLDGLVDRTLDRVTDQPNQLGHYASDEEAAERLTLIASESLRLAADLPQGELHTMILAGMGGYYLAHPEAWEPESREISRGVLEALGPLAKAALLVHRLRRGPSNIPKLPGWLAP